MKQRLYYLDTVRIFAIGVVFLFHCCRFFDGEDWHVKSAHTSEAMSIIVALLTRWMMPLFFFISGASTWFAIQKKSAGTFLVDRTRRIFLPLLVGIFFLSPLQVYLERLTHHQFQGSFSDFLPHFFQGWYAFGGNFAWMGLHCWYLLMLFVFSLLFLPLFYSYKRIATNPTWSPLIGISILFVILVTVTLLFPYTTLIGMRAWGGWGLLEHLMVFLAGFFIYSIKGFTDWLSRYKLWFLIPALLLTGFFFVLLVEDGSLTPFPRALLRDGICITTVLSILGYAAGYNKKPNKVKTYANEAVLPFYVLHQAVIVPVGYLVLKLQWGIAASYVLIALGSLLVIALLYEGLIRRFNPLRVVFGMGPAAPQTSAPATNPVSVPSGKIA